MKRNPFLSLWLSGADAAVHRARGHATAAVNRRRGTVVKQAARYWTRAWLAAVAPKRER